MCISNRAEVFSVGISSAKKKYKMYKKKLVQKQYTFAEFPLASIFCKPFLHNFPAQVLLVLKNAQVFFLFLAETKLKFNCFLTFSL